MITHKTVKYSALLFLVTVLVAVGCSESVEAPEAPTTPEPAAEADSTEMPAETEAAAAPEAAPDPEPEPADPADAVLGYWYSEGGDSQIYISKADGEIGGKIVWLKSPTYDEEGDEEFGEPRRDRNNAEEELQDRPIIGLEMIHGFTYDADDGNWAGGSIYDPESGKTYKCQMKLGEGDTLDVRGYIGIPALGRSTVWTRVPEGEEKDETKEAPAPSA